MLGIATSLLGLLFLAAGLNKFSGSALAQRAPGHLGIPTWFYRVAGALELLGVAGLAAGARFAPPLAGVAAIALGLLLVVAAALHLRAGDGFLPGGGRPEGWAPAAIFAAASFAVGAAWFG